MKNKPVFFTILLTLTTFISMPVLAMNRNKKHTKTQKKLEQREFIGKIVTTNLNWEFLEKPENCAPLSPKSSSKKQEQALNLSSKKRHSKSDDLGDLYTLRKEIDTRNKKAAEKEALKIKKELKREALEEINKLRAHNREESWESISTQELENEEDLEKELPTENLDAEEPGSESDQDTE